MNLVIHKNINYKHLIMNKIILNIAILLTLLFSACSSETQDLIGDNLPLSEASEASTEDAITVPTEQSASTTVSLEDLAKQGLGGIHLRFQMSGITQVVLESVDEYQIAGNLCSDKQSIITFSASEGSTLTPNKDYYIVTFPCDLSGGYRLSIYKDGQVASYFGVHQTVEAGSFITPTDLVESELEFADPDAPFIEDERPNLNQATKDALVVYQQNPTEENKAALMEQMGIRYDKVVARKKPSCVNWNVRLFTKTLWMRCKPLLMRWLKIVTSAWSNNSIG